MKKIIAAFDGLKYSESTRDYAIEIASQSDSFLVGVFLDDRTYTSYNVYQAIINEELTGENVKHLQKKDRESRMAATADFEKACRISGIQFTIHHDHNIAINELKHESVYADLLIINSQETLNHVDELVPTRFMRDLLGDVQCPVLVVPPMYRRIEKVVLLYDGKPSSVYSIKMFSYLVPPFEYLPTEVISVNPVDSSLHIPDGALMKEFVKRHFPSAKYVVMQGAAEEEVTKLLKLDHNNAIVVLGAYRRGTVSRWFHESMADTLLKNLKVPLFIAHN